MAYTQQGRIATITSPAGLSPDTLLLASMSGSEGMSRLFNYTLELFSEKDALPLETMVGKGVTVELMQADGTPRFFNGVLARFAQSGREGRFVVYQADLVPWMWRLTRTSDCRIFQEKSVPVILQDVFEAAGLKDYEFKLNAGSYDRWKYCVQYRETDFNFVSRLMEQEGIFYYFRHEKTRHVLVIGDSPAHCPKCPGQSKIRYVEGGGGVKEEDEISGWLHEQELQAGQYALKDYHFIDPDPSLLVSSPTAVQAGDNGALEIFDYPGEYVNLQTSPGPDGEKEGKKDKGQKWVQRRMEIEDASTLTIRGQGSCRALAPGHHFDLLEHYRNDHKFDKSYLVTTVHHQFSQRDTYIVKSAGQSYYQNSFTCIPYTIPYRPARFTPKPIIQGPQTAVVVGAKGEEIDVDKYGRVWVQFHWDREGKSDEKSSCRIRVSQSIAGNRWGGVFLPRVGQEVIVQFLEGDPDQPIVTGCVYNGTHMPPYDLPEHRTRSGFKTRSSLKGGADNFNEIRFEDKKDKEEIRIHAERRLNVIVEANADRLVGGNSKSYTKKESSTIVQQDAFEWYRSSHRTTVANEDFLEAPTIVVEAGTTLSLKGPGGFIVIDAAGVTISGTIVKINSGGAAAVSSIGSGAIGDKAKEPGQA